jgi:hypothetical protein
MPSATNRQERNARIAPPVSVCAKADEFAGFGQRHECHDPRSLESP